MEEPVAEPVERMKRPDPEITLYQYVPTEPVVFAPHVPVISPQQEIDELKELVRQLMDRVRP
jgi:hypothetical protein